MTRGLFAVAVAAALALASAVPAAARSGAHGSHQSSNATSATLRGSSGNNQKGGRYLAPATAKKLPGKRKPPTLTLKRGKNQE